MVTYANIIIITYIKPSDIVINNYISIAVIIIITIK